MALAGAAADLAAQSLRPVRYCYFINNTLSFLSIIPQVHRELLYNL